MELELFTRANINKNRIVYAKCVEKDSLQNIDIKGKSFLLLIVYDGTAVFLVGERKITAVAPCFVCFSETENPVLVESRNFKSYSIYFHPQFLNINMTFAFIRSEFYGEVAQVHDLFLLKPFVYNIFVIPIQYEYLEQVVASFFQMKAALELQTDWYWSCRARSYFMEIIICLERLCSFSPSGDAILNDGVNGKIKNDLLRNAILFIESHYGSHISFSDICRAAQTNHTTLVKIFRDELFVTPMEYLWQYRVSVAKKHLAFTEIPLKDITARCGFKTVQHFSRIFKEHTGKTPLQFRKQAVEDRIANLQGDKRMQTESK
ncbi:MAG TPA: AraC family transcriptional regulator [Bacillota bacterium]|nr:AraC family transcriptional regulator [Bacillota bacterium]HOK69563.1 AraC family transcriptional regulator [Bacillota bacterium]HPP85957.1 AraC family transcriptional regulator [Bacillota bacterium]